MSPTELVSARPCAVMRCFVTALGFLSVSVWLSAPTTAQVLIDENFDIDPCIFGGWNCMGNAVWVPPLPLSNRCDILGADPNNPFGDGLGDCTLYPDEGYVLVTPGQPGQVGGLFHNQPRTFDDVKLTAVVELRDGTRPFPADGMCIVIVGTSFPPGLGPTGGGMGATDLGFVPTMVLELDTWGGNAGDGGNPNHVQFAWSPEGFSGSLPISPPPYEGVKVDIAWPLNNLESPPASPNRFTAELYLQAGRAALFLTNSDASPPLSRTHLFTYDILGYFPFEGYIGVTAATGSATENHILHSLRVETLPQGFCLDPPGAVTRAILGRRDPRVACGDFGIGDQLDVELTLAEVREPGAACGAPDVIMIRESPPAGWTPFDISDGGNYDSGAGMITWFLSGGALAPGATVRYKVQPPGDAADVVTWTGDLGEGSQPVDRILTGGERRLVRDAPFSACGGVRCWNMLGAFTRGGGAAPGEGAIRLDYLTDGLVPEAAFVWYPGARIDTAFGGDGVSGSAAAGALGGTMDRNPGGIPEVFPWNDPDGFVDLNGDVFGGDLDNVMTYSQAYVVNTTGGPLQVYLGISSDDSIQVVLNGAEVWVNSLGRAGSSDCFPLDVTGPHVLVPGTNSLVVKTFEGFGDWNFSLRFQDSSQNPITSGLHVEKAPAGSCVVPPVTAARDIASAEIVRVEGQNVSGWSAGATYDVNITFGNVRASGSGCPSPTSLVVQEHVPAGWTIINASDGGVVTGGTITWNLSQASIHAGKVLSYRVSAAGDEADVRFTGTVADPFVLSPSPTTGERILHGPTGFSRQCFIQDWLLLGPYRQPPSPGAAPGVQAIQRDHLTDGVALDEINIEPRAGDTVMTAYAPQGARSTGLEATANPDLNPGGIPTWYEWTDADDTIDFTSVCRADENQVMFHALAYLDVEADMTVDIGLSSDDSVQVLLDGEEIWINNIARADGGANTVLDVIDSAFTPALSPLRAGRHKLLVKVFEGEGDHSFRLRLQDPATGEGICEGLAICRDPVPGSCAPPPGPLFLRGDSNSDGWVSMGDVLHLLDFIFQGGATPSCPIAADVDGNGQFQITDGVRLLGFLFQGGVKPGNYPQCELAPPGVTCVYPISPCGALELRNPDPTFRLELAVERLVEEGVTVSPVTGIVQILDTEPGNFPVRGWSLSIRAGPYPECEIVNATVQGTLGALESEGGLRKESSFHRTELVQGPGDHGVVSTVLLGLRDVATLPGNEVPHDLLRLGLQGTFMPGGCSPCLVEFRDGLRRTGEPVRNLLDSDSRDYQPFSRPVEVRFCSAIEPIEPGGLPASFSLPAASPTRLFKLLPRPAVGRVITLDLEGADPLDQTALYVRWGGAPSPTEFDHAADSRGRASQRLVIPFARDEACYVLVKGNIVSGEDVSASLRVSEAGIALERASADCDREGCDGMIHLAAQGAGFDEMTSFFLERPPGLNLPALASTVVLAERAELEFDLSPMPAGVYDLVARKSPSQEVARLVGALRIERSRIGPRLEVSLVAPAYYREYQLRSVTLRYANTGDEEMAAPLFEVKATTGTLLGVSDDAGLRRWELPYYYTRVDDSGPEMLVGPLQLLGIHAQGVSGRLPPGASGEIPVLFRHPDPFSEPPGADERLEISVRAINTDPAVELSWSSLRTPQGMSSGDWELLRTALAAGDADYHEALSQVASRLTKRGERPWRVKDLFRFAALSVTDRPTAVVIGTARGPSQAPLVSRLVAAKQGGSVKVCALTDSEGAFSLGPLPDGLYQLAVEGHVIPLTEVPIAGGEDFFPVVIEAKEEGGSPIDCPAADPDAGLFPSAPGLPEGLLLPVASASLKPAVSEDPNAKEGPDEDLPVTPGQRITYTIQFENSAQVEGAARRIVLVDKLSPLLDTSTIDFTEVQLGETKQLSPSLLGGISLASGYSWSTNAGRYELNAQILVNVNYPPELPTISVEALYDVSVVKTLDELAAVTKDLCGSEIDPRGIDPEHCAIQEELAAVAQGLEASPGVAYMICVIQGKDPHTGSEEDLLRWNDDRVGLVPPNLTPPMGQGLVSYEVQVSATAMDGETIENNARIIFDTNPGDPTDPVLHTVRVPFRRGDVNDDATVNLTDPIAILNHLFSGTTGPECIDAGDANDDGLFNISDPVAILNFLFLGTATLPAPGPFECGFDFTPDVDALTHAEINLGCGFDPRRCE